MVSTALKYLIGLVLLAAVHPNKSKRSLAQQYVVGSQDTTCMRITCVTKRSQKISASQRQISTRFLVESTRDTFSIDRIMCACGCEYPTWKSGVLIYLGHGDTITITSDVSHHSSYWYKSSTVQTSNGCISTLYTGPWEIVE
jgi:hypothetical protein